ncbi:MAG: O-antigen ligase family protein, partial [Planctomycetota bacterium]
MKTVSHFLKGSLLLMVALALLAPWVIAASGLLLLITWCLCAVPDTPRRGALLAVGCGIAVMFGLHLWPRRRALVLAAGCMMVLLGSWWVLRQLQDDVFLYDRGLRLLHWASAADGMRAWWPWGGGAWGAFHLGMTDSEHYRWGLMLNEPLDHVHNEFLSAVVEYGLIGGLLCIGTVVVVVRAALRIGDPACKAAVLALLASWAVLLAVDPGWGLPLPRVWMGVLLGIVLVCSRGNAEPQPRKRRPWELAIVSSLMALVLLPLICDIPAALLAKSPRTTQLARALAATAIPQVGESLLTEAEQLPMPNMHGMGDPFTAMAWKRLGPGPSIVEQRFTALHMLGMAELHVRAQPQPILTESDQREHERHLVAWYQAALALNHMYPCRLAPYLDLDRIRQAGCAAAVLSPRRARRVAWIMADPTVTPPDLSMPVVNLEDVADLWAACRWWVRCHPEHEEIHAALARLLKNHARALSDPQPFLEAIAGNPQRASRWAWRHHVALAGICRRSARDVMVTCLRGVTTKPAARIVYALLCRLYVVKVAKTSAGTVAVPQPSRWPAQEERLRLL